MRSRGGCGGKLKRTGDTGEGLQDRRWPGMGRHGLG